MAGKGPLDRAADLLVYAPVGLLATARSLVPELATRGREQVGGQLTAARMVGELAIREGRRQAGSAFDRARHQAEAMIDTVFAQDADQDVLPDPAEAGAPTAAEAGGSADAAPTDAAPTDPVPVEQAAARTDPGFAPVTPTPPADAEAPAVDDLAITGYGSLAASQVVPRLAGLSPDELEAVRAYEAATRRRRTILTRIAQLQAR